MKCCSSLHLKLTNENKNTLKEIAFYEKSNMTTIINSLIENYLKNRTKNNERQTK